MTAEVHRRPDPAPIARVPIVDVDLPPSIPPSEVGGDIMDGEEAGGKRFSSDDKDDDNDDDDDNDNDNDNDDNSHRPVVSLHSTSCTVTPPTPDGRTIKEDIILSMMFMGRVEKRGKGVTFIEHALKYLVHTY